MKRYILLILTVSILVMMENGDSFCIESNAGIGIIIGEPTGISGKLWAGENTAVAGAIAWSFVENPHLHIHADWLHHNRSFLTEQFEIDTGELPLYYGIGGRIKIEDESRVGVRFVVGVSYIFEEAPFDIFFEVAPIMDIAPETKVSGNSAIGVRYWFE